MAEEWPVIETRAEYDCEWFTVGYDLVERPDGETARYYWVDPADTVAVVAVDGDDLVMVEQYRPRQRETFLSCPAGGVDDGESFESAAARELREETGYAAEDVEVIETYHQSGWLRQRYATAVATDLTPGDPHLDDGEFVEVRRMPAEEAMARTREPPINAWSLLPMLIAAERGYLPIE